MPSETYKIAKMQAWRDIGVAALDAVKSHPFLGLVSGFALAEGFRAAGIISQPAKQMLFGAGVSGSLLSALGKGGTNPLQLAALPVQGARAIVKKIKGSDEQGYKIPKGTAVAQAEQVAANIQDDDEQRGFWRGIAHVLTFGKVK